MVVVVVMGVWILFERRICLAPENKLGNLTKSGFQLPKLHSLYFISRYHKFVTAYSQFY